jgi:D-beta-D-heptose 7-phosphate kinase/D-beta-D-heptose 1-phosphate adenosyltransferase
MPNIKLFADTSIESTTVKTRLISMDHQTQIMRFDRENILTSNKLCDKLSILATETDIEYFIVSDYAKGAINKDVMDLLHSLDRKLFIDPKPNHMKFYSGNNFLLKPNKDEYEDIQKNYSEYLNDYEWILNTRGKEGMILYDKNKNSNSIKYEPINVFNVTGAGDTALATLVVSYGIGHSMLDSSKISNLCSRWVVSQPGTTVITKQVFYNILKEYSNE